MQSYEVVFFDLDNTIYNYEDAHQPSLAMVLQQFANHFDITLVKTKELYATARREINQRLHGQASCHSRLLYFKEMITGLKNTSIYSDALLFEKIYWQHFLSEMTINKEALKLIKQLHKKGVRLGIITDLNTQIQLQKMKKLKIESYFEQIITSEEAGVEKPDSAIFYFALERFDVKADKTALIGDNIKTDAGSEEVGIKCFLI